MTTGYTLSSDFRDRVEEALSLKIYPTDLSERKEAEFIDVVAAEIIRDVVRDCIQQSNPITALTPEDLAILSKKADLMIRQLIGKSGREPVAVAKNESSPGEQMELFPWQIAALQPSHSRTIELFDSIPKYIFDRHSKATDKIRFINRRFKHKGLEYLLRITPAPIQRGANLDEGIAMFPGVREEMVVRAITHLAAQQVAPLKIGRDKTGEPFISATFTIAKIRQCLKKHGHTYSNEQIDEAIRVCRLSSLDVTCTTDGRTGVISSGIFMAYSALDEAGDVDGSRAQRYIVFNPLVTKSILEKTTHAINFDRAMSLKSPLSRWLYDRISHNYRQASKGGWINGNGYHIALRTIERESGIAVGQTKESLRVIRAALTELHDRGVLDKLRPYEERITHGEAPRRGGRATIADVVWTLYPSNQVAEEIILDNKAVALT